MNLVNGLLFLPLVSLYHYAILFHRRTCVTYESSKWFSSLTISIFVSLYSCLLSLLILAVCRTCVSYHPSKWFSIVSISVSVSVYTTL